MKCKLLPVYNGQHNEPMIVVEVKLHRHTIEIEGLVETDAMELEELLMKVNKIKVRRYEDDKDSKVQGNKSHVRHSKDNGQKRVHI